MLKSDETNLYVDEELASYVPDMPQRSPLLLQRREPAALHHKSLLPVSRVNRNFCGGDPSVMLQKYSVSCSCQQTSRVTVVGNIKFSDAHGRK
jgi:hypothetical protein